MSGTVRNTVITKDSLKDEKKKRLTGRDDQAIQNEIFKIETSSYRGKTGLPPNPKHKVNYLNHPYDNEKEEGRRLDADGTLYRPMRVRYFTDAMLQHKTASNAEQINFVENVILPYAADFWSKALSVVPVEGKLKMDSYDLSNRMFCGDSEFSEVPQSHIEEGVEDADLVWYVSATPSTRFCGSSTLAVAVACNFDQFDRPTAGAINFCLNQVELNGNGGASDAVKKDNFDVAVHEAAHILGMSSNAFRYFYDSETGKPRTSRPFQTQTVTCVDGVERTLGLPAENTLKMGEKSNGQRYASLVTPRVQTVVRNHFNCQSLEGAQLENQPTGSESCIGDHWEERYFYPEAMTSVMSPTTNVLSPLTLALMEDSGWYVANYSQANLLPWGHGVGCDFLSESCLQGSSGKTTVPGYSKEFFCSAPNSRGCSSGQTHKMACTVLDYSLYYPPAYPPERFQYFTTSDTLGGPEEIDYCPVYGSTYSGLKPEQLECENSNNVDNFNLFSEYYGEGSKCYNTNTGSGRCYLTQCAREPFPHVKVNIRGTWFDCEKDFQEITFQTNNAGILNGELICPRLSSVCPNLFCPANCAGRGVCDYEHVVNGTIRPTCKCFNQNDTSVACTDSYIPKGDFQLDNLPSITASLGFFDPLISVFVDAPQSWDTVTWAWAAGLLALLLMMVICVCLSFCPEKKYSKGRRKKSSRHSSRHHSSRHHSSRHHSSRNHNRNHSSGRHRERGYA